MMHEPLTFGDLKRWAADNDVPDEAVLETQDGRKIRDLSAGPDGGDGGDTPYLTLQHTWG